MFFCFFQTTHIGKQVKEGLETEPVSKIELDNKFTMSIREYRISRGYTQLEVAKHLSDVLGKTIRQLQKIFLN